jgi:hypothetical protein
MLSLKNPQNCELIKLYYVRVHIALSFRWLELSPCTPHTSSIQYKLVLSRTHVPRLMNSTGM